MIIKKGKNQTIYYEKKAFSDKVNRPGRFHNRLNRQNHQGKFLRYMLILKLLFHVIGIVYIVPLATFPVLISFSSM